MKKNHLIDECDGGAACGGNACAAVGGDAGGSAVGTCDCLGSCSHDGNSFGFFGPGCFHVPELCNGGSVRRRGKNGKKKKYKFEKGMKVITSYDQLVAENDVSAVEMDYVSIPKDKFLNIIERSKIENHKYNIASFEKYIQYGTGDEEYVALQEIHTDKILAAAVLCYGSTGDNDCYVLEIQSLNIEFAAELLKRILKYTENTWLAVDLKNGQESIDFYRNPKFKLRELKMNSSIGYVFFITNDVDEMALKSITDFIQSSYQA